MGITDSKGSFSGGGNGHPRRPGYSLRICLIRAIASSTACSGLMPSVDDAVDSLGPDVLVTDLARGPFMVA